MNRRRFLSTIGAVPAALLAAPAERIPAIQTVLGPVGARDLGLTLVHEHVLVDFIGAAEVSRTRYRTDDVVRTVLPHLREAKVERRADPDRMHAGLAGTRPSPSPAAVRRNPA